MLRATRGTDQAQMSGPPDRRQIQTHYPSAPRAFAPLTAGTSVPLPAAFLAVRARHENESCRPGGVLRVSNKCSARKTTEDER